MCYPKPGPRCSNHAKKAYNKAQVDYKKDNTPENKEALVKATRDFMTTPAGIKTLERLAERENDKENKQRLTSQAQKAREARKKAIDAYKKETGQEVPDEEDSIVRPSQFMRRTFLNASYVEASNENFRRSQKSYERSDTDGALSQFANDRMSLVNKYKADLADQGGLSEFPAVYDTQGNIVPAVQVDTEYGPAWGIIDKNNPDGKFTGFFNPSRAKDPERAKENNAKKGFYLGTAIVPAKADLVGGQAGIVSTYAAILPKNRKMGNDAIPVDNGHTDPDRMDSIREKTYSVAQNAKKDETMNNSAQHTEKSKVQLEHEQLRQAEKDKREARKKAREKMKTKEAEGRKKNAELLADVKNCQECKNGSPVPHYPSKQCRLGGVKPHCTCSACF